MKTKSAMLLITSALAVAALTGCEPAVTITAKTLAAKPGCGSGAELYGTAPTGLEGQTVVLQRTVNGNYQDWIWVTLTTGDQPHKLTGTIEQGRWRVGYKVPDTTNTLHLRVRTEDGKNASNGVYITPTEYDDGQCEQW